MALFIPDIIIGLMILMVSRYKLNFDRKYLRDFIVYGTPHCIVICCGFCINYVDRFFIGKIMDITSVGIYDISYTVASAFIFLFYRSFNIYSLPRLTNSYFHDKTDRFSITLYRLNKAFIFVLLVAGTITLLLSPKLVEFLFPGQYSNEMQIIPFVCIAVFVQCFSLFSSLLLDIQKRVY